MNAVSSAALWFSTCHYYLHLVIILQCDTGTSAAQSNYYVKSLKAEGVIISDSSP